MAIDKINFSYPKGTLQSVFDNEALTALELAAKTSKKVDECVEIVNGVEQTAIEATAIVDDMYVIQNQFVTDNSDTRAQLVNDNQLYLDGLTASKTQFETDLNASKTQFESDLNASKTQFETDMTTAVNNVITNADNTVSTAVNTKVDALISDGTIETLINDNILMDVRSDIKDIAYNIKSEFGAVGDGITDDTQAFIDMASFVNSRNYTKIYIPSGIYKINQQITINKNVSIVGDNEKASILDYSTATGEFADNICLMITGNAITTLPAPTTDLAKNSSLITFSNEHNLVVGDIITILDANLYSWSEYREYYRKGEMCKITNVNGLIVTIDQPLFDSYTNNANLKINKLTTINANVEKIGLNLQLTETLGRAGLIIRYGKDCKIIDVEGKGSNYTHFAIESCYNSFITKAKVDYSSPAIGYNYGFSISNCHKVNITDCVLKTERHGLAIGGGDSLTSIINRNLNIDNCNIGSYTTTGADMHGNVEFVRYKNCTLENGVIIAGDNTSILNCSINEDPQGIAIYFGEVKGMSHNILNNVINCKRYTQSWSSGNGVIKGTFGVNLKNNGNLLIKNNKLTLDPLGALIGLYNLSNVDFNVIIDNNDFIRKDLTYSVERGVTLKGLFGTLKISNNTLERSDILIKSFDGDIIHIKNNISKLSCGNGVDISLSTTTNRNSIISIEDNLIINSAVGGMVLIGKDNANGSLTLKNNTILDCNELTLSGSASTDSCYYINKFKTVEIKNNVIGDRRETVKQRSLYFIDTITNLIEKNNNNIGYQSLTKTITNIINNISGILFNQDYNERRIAYASAIPITGTWAKGSIIYNTTPTAGGFIGWICLTTGSPGTWKGFGLIEA